MKKIIVSAVAIFDNINTQKPIYQ